MTKPLGSLPGWALVAAALFGAASTCAKAESREDWTTYRADGLAVEYPAGIFTSNAGPTEKGSGRRLKSEDGRYQFASYSLPNPRRQSPRSYLKSNLIINPATLVYRRVTDRFFVLSSVRNGRIFYSRCNFDFAIQCIYLEYPANEKSAWDRIVTRISYSLRSDP